MPKNSGYYITICDRSLKDHLTDLHPVQSDALTAKWYLHALLAELPDAIASLGLSREEALYLVDYFNPGDLDAPNVQGFIKELAWEFSEKESPPPFAAALLEKLKGYSACQRIALVDAINRFYEGFPAYRIDRDEKIELLKKVGLSQ